MANIGRDMALRHPELLDALGAAGVAVRSFVYTPDGRDNGRGVRVELDVPDEQEATATAALAAHDPAAIDASRAAAQQQDAGDRQAARQAVANLTAAIDGWATLTAAQKDQAALTNLRCTRALSRVLARAGLL